MTVRTMNNIQTTYINEYLSTLPQAQRNRHKRVVAGYFCADEENANVCADLVLRGKKTATCGLKYWYDSGLEVMPQAGDLQVVTDWSGYPVSIIEITGISECKFSEVSEEFAALEGEGDRSLAWWRETHLDFFTKECAEHNLEFSEEMILVLEKFMVVYSQNVQA